MTVVIITLATLLLLHISEARTAESLKQKNYATLLSKRRFLSPKNLHGSYSRFLEVSENSTLCPNTVTHNTNGVLHPSGYIRMPLGEIDQDGIPCSGPGDLVIRFRRRMSPKEVEQEFNITADASGIDKMVREILLALDGFYFGRQTNERNCQNTRLPANTAFFFTSQAKPFAANVGVLLTHDPKIMLLVDKTRVCAFSGSFTAGKRLVIGAQPVPSNIVTLKHRTTPSPEQKMESPSNMIEREAPRQIKNNQKATSKSAPHQPRRDEQNSQTDKSKVPTELPNTLSPSVQYKVTPVLSKGNMAEPSDTLTPFMQNKEMPPPQQGNTTKQPMKEYMKGSAPPSMFETDPVNEHPAHNGHTDSHDGKKKQGTFDRDIRSISPSPSKLPQQSSKGSLSSPYKHPYGSLRPSNRPSRYPIKDPSQTSNASINPSRSRTPKSYETWLPSASPARPRHLSSIITTDGVSPSPSPRQMAIGGEIQSSSPSHGEIHDSSPKISATVLPKPTTAEVIIGDSSSTCFPSSAIVMLSNGGIQRMDELSIGNSVSVGNGRSSSIIDFSHFDRTIVSAFLHLQTDSGRNLTLTGSHFVYTAQGIRPADKVILGDYLKLSDGRPARVVSISRIWSRGLHNPQTIHGDIVVNGFVVSTYTLTAAPMTAHALLAPVRYLYDVGFRVAIVSKLANQPAIVRAFRSLLWGSIHAMTF